MEAEGSPSLEAPTEAEGAIVSPPAAEAVDHDLVAAMLADTPADMVRGDGHGAGTYRCIRTDPDAEDPDDYVVGRHYVFERNPRPTHFVKVQ